ncbi:MAG: MarR family transcriptional regulator, temperature-dependent positive regulator of motility [Miltoncostaeaceae bacterium]|jgi:DNA-binding MarR family transcriptional regulator|nr:MarR family transcriptional regulator, temperature-dependent positive regulator of motility [Miltoncostaeaceae bacterium]
MNDSSPPGALVLLTRLAKVIYRRSSEDLLGMRLRQFVALTLLRDGGTLPQQELCETMHLDPNNVVLLLNDLETAGHVRRRRDPDDRRRHIVELTDEGREALERAERAQASIEGEVLAALSPEEQTALRELLSRALQGAGALETPV